MVKITQLKDREDLIGRLERESLLEVIDHLVKRKSPMYLWIRFGGEEGDFYFREGKMIYASCKSLRGKESAYHLLAFRSGVFRIVRGREPETENVEIDWQNFKENFQEDLQKLILNFLLTLEGKFILKITDFKLREFYSYMESGGKAQLELLEHLFQTSVEAGLKSLVRGIEESISQARYEIFASIFYIPELRYFLGVSGEKREQGLIHKWVQERFIPQAKEAVSSALRRSDLLLQRAGILAIIPDRALAEHIHSSLTNAGFKVWICQDGFEGLVRVEDYKPDLIILSSELDRIRAEEVYARLKRKPESQMIPVICLVLDPHQKELQTQSSGDLYLESNFSSKKLVKIIENLLELK